MTVIVRSPSLVLVPSGTVGTPGPPGPPGTGSTIGVQDEATLLGTAFTRLKFTGTGATASDAGGGIAQIDIPGASGGDSDTIYLAQHSVVADGTTVNPAAPVQALVDAIAGTRGARIVLPYGTGPLLFDKPVNINRPCIIEGYGYGTSSSGADTSANTLVKMPAGWHFLRINPGGQNTVMRGFRVIQTSLLSTSVTGSYTYNGLTNQTLTLSAAGDFQNGQIIQIDGAGIDIILQDRTFTLANGATSGTYVYTDSLPRGNSIGYIGQHIQIAGASLPANTTITAWGAGTFTLSNAATAAGAAGGGAVATVTTPLITEIVSGGGTTTLTFKDIPHTGGKTVSGAKVSHCAPGIYSSIQCHTRDVEVFSCQAGIVRNGISTSNNVADNGSDINSRFSGTKFGAVYQGADANANSAWGCNYAVPEVGVLDNSYLGNFFYGCHWAFNCGIMVASSGAETQVWGGYMESGTSFIAPAGGSMIYGTVGFTPGSGFGGWGLLSGGTFQMSPIACMGPISAKQDALGLGYAGNFTGGLFSEGAGIVRIRNHGGGIGTAPPSDTTELQISINAATQVDGISYNNTHGTFQPLRWWASQHDFRIGSSVVGQITSTGMDMPNGQKYYVSGTQVVGARQAAVADATNATDVITQLNALLAKLRTHGLIAP
jgi:hypothetical protein